MTRKTLIQLDRKERRFCWIEDLPNGMGLWRSVRAERRRRGWVEVPFRKKRKGGS